MPRKPNQKSGKTNLALSSDAKRCLIALSAATGDDMNRVVEDAIRHYADLLIRQNPNVKRAYPDLARCACINQYRLR